MEVNNNESDLITTDQACRIFGVSQSTLRRWWKDKGWIAAPYKPTAKSQRWSRSNLEEFFRNNTSEEDLSIANLKKVVDRHIVNFKLQYNTGSKREKAKNANPEKWAAEMKYFDALIINQRALENRLKFVTIKKRQNQ